MDATNTTKDLPLVSVAVSSYNCRDFILETLDSIRRQTYPNIQLIIVDDCSRDDSVPLIRNWIANNFPEAEFLVHEQNQGVTKVFANAFDRARGKYFSFIGSDDIMEPEKIAVQVEVLENTSEDYAATFSDSYLMKEDGSPHFGLYIQRFRELVDFPDGDIYNLLAGGNFIPAHAVLTRSSHIKAVGGFDTTLAFEDWDLWLRLAQRYKFIYTKTPLVHYRIRRQSLMQSGQVRASGDSLTLLAKHFPNEEARKRYYEVLTFAFFENPEVFERNIPLVKEHFAGTKLAHFAKYRWALQPAFRMYSRWKKRLLSTDVKSDAHN